MLYSRAQVLTEKDLLSFNLMDEDGTLKKLFYTHFTTGTASIGEKAFQLPYFTQIGSGTLDPQRYGSLIVLDAYYCFNSTYSLYCIYDRVKNAPDHYTPTFIRSVGDLYTKYYKFVGSFVTDWHLKSATPLPEPEKADSKILLDLLETCVEPTENMQNYAQFERNIATDNSTEPLYALISMFPCYAFWPWLFWKYGTPADTNLYKGWIQSNQGGGSATLVDTLVENEWIKQGKVFDAALALSIMNKSMEYEVTMFTEAVPTGVSVL